MTENSGIVQNSKENRSDLWFEDIINTLQTDKLQMDLDVMSPEKKEMYNNLIFGNFDETALQIRKDTNKYFVSRMLFDYIKELKSKSALPEKIAFDLSGTKVLVWAEIPDDDFEMEKSLIVSEAKINSTYSPKGFGMSSTIVEKIDGLKTPPHYKPFELKITH